MDTTKPSDASKMQAAFSSTDAAPKLCGLRWVKGIQGRTLRLEMIAASLDDFSKYLGAEMDRPLIERTGIPGKFDFHIEFAPDETTPGLLPNDDKVGGPTGLLSDQPNSPPIFIAVQQQLGLKLERTKGPGEFLVIDNVEKPLAN